METQYILTPCNIKIIKSHLIKKMKEGIGNTVVNQTTLYN